MSTERGEEILGRLASIREQMADLEGQKAALIAERLRLYEEGQALDPRLTQAAMAAASGITDVAVTLALKQARERALATTDHEGGLHSKPITGCPVCAQEKRTAAAG